jgi:molecular chaperone DnaK (HSP70)
MNTNNSIKNSQVVGIDLGTTNTVIGFCDDTGKPKIIPNLDGEMLTPSIVYVGPGLKEILVGTAARNMMMLDPARVRKEVKRDVGTDKVYFQEGGQDITPEWCQARILRYGRESAIHYFGDERAASKMVVSVPAYYGERERQSVKRSVEMAGGELLQLINEPTAAGLAHGIAEKQGDRLVVIPDIGGGTFDVSLVKFEGVCATVLASNGDKHLGGADVDNLLLERVCEEFRKQHGLEVSASSHPADYFRMWEEVIRQKHMLASRTEVKICVVVDGKQVILPLDRQELTALAMALMDRAEKLIRETIQNAKVNPDEIKHVLEIGGSSRLVPYQERIQAIFGKDRIAGGGVSPDLAVAEGAVIHAVKVISAGGKSLVGEALQAIPAPAITHTDVMPHSLGVAVQDRVSAATYCSVILERNTTIPCRASRQYASVDDRQTRFKVTVLQGENDQPAKDCLVVGEKEMELTPRKSTEPSIEVNMGYDASGMVTVAVRDLITGKTEDITVRFYNKPATATSN